MTHGTENTAASPDGPLLEVVDRTGETDVELQDEELDVVVAGLAQAAFEARESRGRHGWGVPM